MSHTSAARSLNRSLSLSKGTPAFSGCTWFAHGA